jgi:DNA-directed RNA polymerase specialized sigma24 family protein
VPSIYLQSDTQLANNEINSKDFSSNLYKAYSPAIYGFLIKILSDTRKAQQVLAQTFSWATSSLTSSGNPQNEFIPLLNKARNEAVETLINMPAVVINNTNDRAIGLHNPRLQAFIKELPLIERTLIALFYYRGLTPTEISEVLQLPLTLVETKMKAIATKLQQY